MATALRPCHICQDPTIEHVEGSHECRDNVESQLESQFFGDDDHEYLFTEVEEP